MGLRAKQVPAWETSDGRVFLNLQEATEAERKLVLQEFLENAWSGEMSKEEMLDWLIGYRLKLLEILT